MRLLFFIAIIWLVLSAGIYAISLGTPAGLGDVDTKPPWLGLSALLAAFMVILIPLVQKVRAKTTK